MNTTNCTHPVPPNKFGIIAHHTEDNVPIDDATLKKIIDGPIAACEEAYQDELKKVVVISEDDL